MELKELVWLGSSRKDMKALPAPVRREFGLALFAAQCGETPPDAKPLKGFSGAGVLEIVEDYRRDTYRAVYTVRFATKVFVLHVFQKKSTKGVATPKHEMELIRDRLNWAHRLHYGTK